MIVEEPQAIADLAARMRSRGVAGDWSDLAREHIAVRPHPGGLPIALFDYGEAANYQLTPWTPLQTVSRGLVLDDQGAIVAWPFSKFFGVGDRDYTTWDALFANPRPATIAPKLDGSMVMAYWYNGQWIWQSRGGWTNFVTERAQARAQALYAQSMRNWPIRMTLIFELTLNDRPIIVDHPATNLTLIGARDVVSGKLVPPVQLASMADRYGLPAAVEPVTVVPNGERLRAFRALAGTTRQAEGWVITFDNGLMVKVKTKWYQDIQRAMKVATVRQIYARLRDETLEDWRLAMPWELRPWIDHIAGVLREKAYARMHEARLIGIEARESGALKADQVAHLRRVASDGQVAAMAISLLSHREPHMRQAINDIDLTSYAWPPVTPYLERYLAAAITAEEPAHDDA